MAIRSVDTPSAHHDARRAEAKISLIVLHYTGTRTAEQAAAVYRGDQPDPAGRISPHYMIDRDGTRYRFVAESHRAWHAGKSFWRGETDINSISIGIELVNEGAAGGYPPYPPGQIESLIDLCRDIAARHGIAPEGILGHSDVAPGRKDDPGPQLDWRALAARGVGLWPQPQDPQEDFISELKTYGYDPHVSREHLASAFCLHFCPESDEKLAARRLAGLLRHARDLRPG